jgi:hypothetical protein
MNQVKKEILKELEEVNNQSLVNSEILHKQSTTIETIGNSLETIEKDLHLSKWYLNLINATFGKVYKTFHNTTILKKNKSNIKPFPPLSKNISSKNILSKNTSSKKNIDIYSSHSIDNSIDNEIYRKLTNIKDINITMSKELDDNLIKLDELNSTITNSQFSISDNITTIKKMI